MSDSGDNSSSEDEDVQQNKKKSEQKVYSKLQLIVNLGTLILILIVSQQHLNIEKSFQINNNLKNHLFKGVLQKKEYTLNRFDIVNWIKEELFTGFYYQNNFTDSQIGQSYKYISNLRFVTKKLKLDDQGKFVKPFQDDQQSYGSENQFIFNSEAQGYQIAYSPFIQSYEDAKDDFSDKITSLFMNNNVYYLRVDFAFYIQNADMVAIMQIDFDLSMAGVANPKLDGLIIRYDQYQDEYDSMRMIIELVIFGLLVFSFFYEFVKLAQKVQAELKEFKNQKDKNKIIQDQLDQEQDRKAQKNKEKQQLEKEQQEEDMKQKKLEEQQSQKLAQLQNQASGRTSIKRKTVKKHSKIISNNNNEQQVINSSLSQGVQLTLQNNDQDSLIKKSQSSEDQQPALDAPRRISQRKNSKLKILINSNPDSLFLKQNSSLGDEQGVDQSNSQNNKEQQSFEEQKIIYREPIKDFSGHNVIKSSQTPNIQTPIAKSTTQQLQQNLNQLKEEAEKTMMCYWNGFLTHVKDIMSLIDLLNVIFLLLAILEWWEFINDNPLADDLKKFNSSTLLLSIDQLTEANRENYNENLRIVNGLNNQFEAQIININNYKYYLGITLFLSSFKALAHIISYVNSLTYFLNIIQDVAGYLFYYLILLASIIISFCILAMYVYGFDIYQFSTFYNTFVQLIGMTLGQNNALGEMYELYQFGTFFFMILYYISVVSIMLNMFWVFMKNTLIKPQGQEQDNQEGLKNAEEVHILYKIYKDYYLKILSRISKKHMKKLKEYIEDQRIYSRQMMMLSDNSENFDINFMENHTNSIEKNQVYMIEKERKIEIKKQKVSFVSLIYSSVMIIFIIAGNSIFTLQYFQPNKQFFFNKEIQRNVFDTQLQSNGTYYNYSFVNDRSTLFQYVGDFYQNVFDIYKVDVTKNQQMFSQAYPPEILQQQPLYPFIKGYTLDFHNILTHDKIRLTIRNAQKKENPSSLKQIANEIIPEFFSPQDSSTDTKYEVKHDFNGLLNNTIYAYQSDRGYENNGGYVFYEYPDQMKQKIKLLLNEGLLGSNTITMVIDYVLVNFVDKVSFIYVEMLFQLGEDGFCQLKEVKSSTLFLLTVESVSDFFYLFVMILLIVTVIYYFYTLVKIIYQRIREYNKWYEMFLLHNLTKAQLYYREQKNPELIRQFFYTIDIPTVLQIIFLGILSLEIILIIFLSYFLLSLYFETIIFGLPLFMTMPQNLKVIVEQMGFSESSLTFDIKEFFNLIYYAKVFKIYVKPLAAGSIIVQCIELIYNLTHNKDVQKVFLALVNTGKDVPKLLFILIGFLTNFCLLSHYILGFNYINFSTILNTYVILTEFLFTVSDLWIFRQEQSWTLVIVFLIPFMLIIRFIMVTFFYALVYRGYKNMRDQYKQIQQNQAQDEDSSLDFTLQDFLIISLELIDQSFKKKKQKMNLDLFVKKISQIKNEQVIDKFDTTLRQMSPNMTIDVWSEKCSYDIKYELDIRTQLKQVNEEILSVYFKQVSQGDFNFFKVLNQDKERKLNEYLIQLKYWNYFRVQQQFFEKLITVFKAKIYILSDKLKEFQKGNSEQEVLQINTNIYIDKLESMLTENFKKLAEIREKFPKDYKNLIKIKIDNQIKQTKQLSVQFKDKASTSFYKND